MCCCPSPNVNGTPGYLWNTPGAPVGIHPIAAPAVAEDEALLFDEPGRCGGLDAHSHHFRVVNRAGSYALLWRHGGGDGRARISGGRMVVAALERLDSHGRYWVLHALYEAVSDAQRNTRSEVNHRWYTAACEKRIKLSRRGGSVRAVIVPRETPPGPTS